MVFLHKKQMRKAMVFLVVLSFMLSSVTGVGTAVEYPNTSPGNTIFDIEEVFPGKDNIMVHSDIKALTGLTASVTCLESGQSINLTASQIHIMEWGLEVKLPQTLTVPGTYQLEVLKDGVPVTYEHGNKFEVMDMLNGTHQVVDQTLTFDISESTYTHHQWNANETGIQVVVFKEDKDGGAPFIVPNPVINDNNLTFGIQKPDEGSYTVAVGKNFETANEDLMGIYHFSIGQAFQPGQPGVVRVMPRFGEFKMGIDTHDITAAVANLSAEIYAMDGQNLGVKVAAGTLSYVTWSPDYLEINLDKSLNNPGLYTLKLFDNTSGNVEIPVYHNGVFELAPNLEVLPPVRTETSVSITVKESTITGYGWNANDSLQVHLDNEKGEIAVSQTTVENDRVIIVTNGGLPDGKFKLEIRDSAGKILGNGSFFLGPIGDNGGDPGNLAPLPITMVFDSQDSYIEFTTRATGVSYTGVNWIEMFVRGNLAQKTLQAEARELFKSADIIFEEISGPLISVKRVEGFTKASTTDPTRLNVRLEFNAGALAPGKTYRISFKDSISKSIIKGILSNIYVDKPEEKNIVLKFAANNPGPDANTPGSFMMLDSAAGQFTNPSLNSSSVSSFKQLAPLGVLESDFDKMYIKGPMLEYHFDFSSVFSDVSKIGFVVKGTLTDDTISDSVISNQKVNASNNITGAISSSIEGDMHLYSVLMDVSSLNITTGKANIEFNDVQVSKFKDLMKRYIWGWTGNGGPDDTQKQKGSVFAVAYNSQGNLIGWSAVSELDDKTLIYTNPKFILGNDAVPQVNNGRNTFQGYFRVDYNAPHPLIQLFYTGLRDQSTTNKIVVKGITTSGVNQYPFMIVMDRAFEQGNYQRKIQFTRYDDPYLVKTLPNGWNEDMKFGPDQIPVNPAGKNIVKFTSFIYVNGPTTVAEVQANNILEFDWIPDPNDESYKYDLINNVNFYNLTNGRVGPSVTSLEVETDIKSLADINKLKLELYKSENGQETVVMEMNAVNSRLANRLYPSTDPTQVKVITFNYSSGINQLGSLPHDTMLWGRIRYIDTEAGVDFTRNMGGDVRIDKNAPEPNLNGFMGLEVKNGVSYYKFKVHFNDLVRLSDLVQNKNTYFTLLERSGMNYIVPNTPVHPAIIENCPDNGWSNGNNPDYVSAVYLYFAQKIGMDQKLKFNGIKDIYDNVMHESRDMFISINTNLKMTLKDGNGNILPNTGIEAIRKDKLPMLQDLNGTQFNWQDNERYIVRFNSDSKGKIDFWLYPETENYVVFRINTVDTQGRRGSISGGMEFNVPVRPGNTSYIPTSLIPPSNVAGSIVRQNSTMRYKEKLIFIEQQFESAYKTNYSTARDFNSNITQTARDQAWANLNKLSTFHVREVTTDAEGNFSVYLKPGTYKLIGKELGDRIMAPLTSVAVSVPTTGSIHVNSIAFAPPSVTGVVYEANNKPLQNCAIIIEKQALNQEGKNSYYLTTDEYGAFAAFIDMPGTYAVTSAFSEWNSNGEGKYYQLDPQTDTGLTFTLQEDANNKPVPLGIQNPIVLPALNTTVNFKIGVDESIAKGDFFNAIRIQFPNNGSREIPTKTDKILMRLPANQEGQQYSITDLCFNGWWQENFQDINFTKESGVPAVVDIDLGKMYNAYVLVKDEAGTAVEGVRVELSGLEGEPNWQIATTNSAGKAYFNLPVDVNHVNGTHNYQIRNFSYNDIWTWLDKGPGDPNNKTFEVTSSHTWTNRAAYNFLQVVKPNFVGTAYKVSLELNGSVPTGQENQIINEGWLNITKIDAPDGPGKWFGFSIKDEGQFVGTLEQPGRYIVEGLFDRESETWIEVKYKFDVIPDTRTGRNNKLTVVKPGTLAITDANAASVVIDMSSFKLGKVRPNFVGTLYKNANNDKYQGFSEGTANVGSGINMQLAEKDIFINHKDQYQKSPWLYQVWIPVAADGTFKASLDPDKVYVVVGVGTPTRWYEFGTGVDILLNQNNNIYPPIPNFSGIIKDFSGAVIANITGGGIGVEVTDANGQNRWDYIQIESDGSFGKQFEDGSVLKVRDLWYQYTESSVMKQGRLQLNKTYQIAANSTATQNMVFKPNFKAEITIGSKQISSTNDNYVGGSIRPVLTVQSFSGTTEEKTAQYNRYLEKPWEFDKWVEGTYDAVNGKVILYGYLGNGSYKLQNIHGSKEGMDINAEFTIIENQPNQIVLNYSPNVTGIIKEGGNPITNAWINFRKVGDTTNQAYFGSKTDGTGRFALKIPVVGEYILEGYSTEGYWGTDGKWINGKWVNVGYGFSITTANINSVTEISITPNLTGKVSRYENNTYTVVPNGWVSIRELSVDQEGKYFIDWSVPSKGYWAQTDQFGVFNLMLPPGKYMAFEAGGKNFWMKPEIVFEINSEKQLVAGSNVSNNVLLVQPQIPNMKGTAYLNSQKTQPLKYGRIAVKPAAAKDYDWKDVKWIETDEYGKFAANLKLGSYKIVEMSNNTMWKMMSMPFTVNTLGIAPDSNNGFEVASNGVISLYPARPNVIGIIKDKNGVVLQDKGWIMVKPASAEEQDWSSTRWIEYKIYDGDNLAAFKENLPAGTYRIIEAGSYNMRYNTDILFTVNSNGSITSTAYDNTLAKLVVTPPQPNVKGILYGNGEQVIPNGWLSIARFENDVQVKMDGQPITDNEGFDKNLNINWHYTMGVQTGKNGEYELRLKPGTYRIVNAGGEGIYYQPMKKFEVTTSSTVNIEVRPPVANLSVSVKNVPAKMKLNMTEGWLNIYQMKNQEKIFVPVKFKNINLSGDFVFEANLPDGAYTISYFGTKNGGTELLKTFTLNGTGNVEVNLGTETGMSVINGTIENNGAPVTERIWLAIQGTVNEKIVKYKVQTDENGDFTFKLPAATQWQVIEISTSSGYSNTSAITGYSFSSDNTNWLVDLYLIQ